MFFFARLQMKNVLLRLILSESHTFIIKMQISGQKVFVFVNKQIQQPSFLEASIGARTLEHKSCRENN